MWASVRGTSPSLLQDEYDLLPRRERARTEVMGSENGARPRRLRRSASIFLKESHRSSHASRMSGAESLQVRL